MDRTKVSGTFDVGSIPAGAIGDVRIRGLLRGCRQDKGFTVADGLELVAFMPKSQSGVMAGQYVRCSRCMKALMISFSQ